VSSARGEGLLPLGIRVVFQEIEVTLARIGPDAGKRAPGRALTATLVVVGPHARLAEAAEAVEQLADIGVRAILISEGDDPSPSVRVLDHVIALEGLRPDYLNNAVAALRLSSLPTVVWWRGGDRDMVDGLADLADRLVLDAEEPAAIWARVNRLGERTATSDLRWTRLTRWRALMAQFFDIPEIRQAARSFNRLSIEGADGHAARLYAGWLSSSLAWPPRFAIDLRVRPGGAFIEQIELGGDGAALTLRLGAGGDCIETAARVQGHVSESRVGSVGVQGLSALIAEELRIRSRDVAFEHAVAAAQGVV
jgi:glucose-6-phosphate dehydrogenase assembly protein OpcA